MERTMHQTFVNSDNLNQVLNSVYQLIQNSALSSALSALSSSKTYARGLVYDYTVTNVGFIIDEDNNNILA
ncbi:MAG: hypothetical protein LBG58_14935, partial [Planctomycetaceae bacterium]|nr:hypothetical protein [Planctomycetaceae bacterium]